MGAETFESEDELPELLTSSEAINILASLRDDQESLHDIALSKLNSDSEFQPILLAVFAALKRSHALTQGFLTLVDAKNEFAASPLVRIQLDSVLRLSAFRVVGSEKQEKLLLHMLCGNEPLHFDKRLRDAGLRAALVDTYPDIDRLYKRTSGYIHFSRDHIIRSIHDWRRHGQVLKNFEYAPLDEMPPWDDAEWRSCILEFCFVTRYLNEEIMTLMGISEDEIQQAEPDDS